MPDLVEYIRAQQAAGVDHASIVRGLLAGGHSIDAINAAFNAVEGRGAPSLQQSSVPPSIAPDPTALPPQTSYVPPSPPPAPPRVKHHHHLSLVLGVIALVIGLAGGTAYAYVEGIGPFSKVPYSESNLFSGILLNSRDIRSAAYKATFTMEVVEREADALPYVPVADPNAAEHAAAYARDVERMREANSILPILRRSKPYPASLSALTQQYKTLDILDPGGQAYTYQVVEGGNNFALGVTFETAEAIQTVEKSAQLKPDATSVNGSTATFSETSYSTYLPGTLPKSDFEQLAELVKRLPADLALTASLGGTTNFGQEKSDWKFNVAGAGDFGDLAYAVDIDVLKKVDDYYFRLNKFPGIFLGYLNVTKGEWVKIDNTSSSTARALFPLPKAESSYKEQRAQLVELLVDMAEVADEKRLFTFRAAPHKETVDGRDLYQYDLRLSKEAVEPFGEKMRTILANGTYPALTPYLRLTPSSVPTSPAARDAFYDYYDKNVRFTLFVDKAGRPALLRVVMRVVPPSDAAQLAGKQVNIEIDLALDNINEPVVIDAPQGAKLFSEILPESTR